MVGRIWLGLGTTGPSLGLRELGRASARQGGVTWPRRHVTPEPPSAFGVG